MSPGANLSLPSQAMSHIPGNFEPHFWDDVVLQFSHTYPTVRQALIALSFIYKGNDRDILNSVKTTVISMDHQHALHQYNGAIRKLIDDLSSVQQDARATLLSCLLFIWIEVLQNNFESAFRHLNSGLKILRDINASFPSPSPEGLPGTHDTPNIYGYLSRSLIRLNSQAALHGTSRVLPEKAVILRNAVEVLATIPESFSDVFESRSFLDNEINIVAGYIRRLRDKDHYASLDMPAIDRFRTAHLDRTRRWHLATMAMVAAIPSLKIPFQISAIAYLQLYHTFLEIVLKTLFCGSEMVFDDYTSEFEQIIKHVECITNKPDFDKDYILSFDMNIIPPLFFLVLKCRVLRLRRQAMDLLKHAPEREGLWRRDSVMKACEWKLDVEEQGRGDIEETEMLPECARIYREHIPEQELEGLTKNARPRIHFSRGDSGIIEHMLAPDDFEDVYAMGNLL
jgi:enamine deaminase RidA (YjgF/YER057c/UK114 family)